MKYIHKKVAAFFCLTLLFNLQNCISHTIEHMPTIQNLKPSDYVTLIISVPESHANNVREAMGKAGAGKIGNYAYCSYSQKGIGRFMPTQGANPHLGSINSIETVIEERIETVCHQDILEDVIEVIKKAHPYEELVIDMYPIYGLGRKTPSID